MNAVEKVAALQDLLARVKNNAALPRRAEVELLASHDHAAGGFAIEDEDTAVVEPPVEDIVASRPSFSDAPRAKLPSISDEATVSMSPSMLEELSIAAVRAAEAEVAKVPTPAPAKASTPAPAPPKTPTKTPTPAPAKEPAPMRRAAPAFPEKPSTPPPLRESAPVHASPKPTKPVETSPLAAAMKASVAAEPKPHAPVAAAPALPTAPPPPMVPAAPTPPMAPAAPARPPRRAATMMGVGFESLRPPMPDLPAQRSPSAPDALLEAEPLANPTKPHDAPADAEMVPDDSELMMEPFAESAAPTIVTPPRTEPIPDTTQSAGNEDAVAAAEAVNVAVIEEPAVSEPPTSLAATLESATEREHDDPSPVIAASTPPLAAKPEPAPASRWAEEPAPAKPKRTGGSSTSIVVIIVLTALIAAGMFLYKRSQEQKRTTAPTPSGQLEALAEPEKTAPTATVAPEVTAAPEATEAPVAPTASAVAPEAPTPAASAAAQPTAAPAVDDAASLDPREGILIVETSGPGLVSLRGRHVGSTNEPIRTTCGSGFLRVGELTDPLVYPPMKWFEPGRAVMVDCQKTTTIPVNIAR